MTLPWPQQATAAASGGAFGRIGPWLAAAGLHGGVAGLLALAPGAAPPVPAEAVVIEVVLLAPEPVPAPAPVAQREPDPMASAPPAPADLAPEAEAESQPEPESTALAVVPTPVPRPASRPTPAPAAPHVASGPPASTSASTIVSPTAPAPTEAAPIEAAPTEAAWQGGGLANPAPVYPRSARLAGQEGRVVLRVQVGADGTVTSLHVVTSSGTDALDASAVRAVRGWRFHPATQAGRPVAAVVEVPVTFRLRDRLKS